MAIREQLQKLSMRQLATVHELLGLDDEYPYSEYLCKGDCIMHILEKDEKEIIKALTKFQKERLICRRARYACQ